MATAAVRVKNQWLFEEVNDRLAAEQRGMEKLLEVIRLDDVTFDVMLDPEPETASRPESAHVDLRDAGWAGNTGGDMYPLEGVDIQSWNVFGHERFALRGFPRFGGPLTTLCVLSRADLEQVARFALRALGVDIVSFGPMPDGKPTGGFLEIGDCKPGDDTYPWEADVELMQGSDGKVYALVESSADGLPTLDGNGHAIEDEEPVDGDRCPQCGEFDRGDADFIKDHGRCRDCHAKWQAGESGDDDMQVLCPRCKSTDVYVIAVSCMSHRRPHTGRWPLNNDGFEWDLAGKHRDGSTTDEVVECGVCGHRGDLDAFNFQTA